MNTYIALLRGINVGGKHIVPMKELRDLMEANGYENVRTYIQSGNIVYGVKKKPTKGIGKLIEAKYGFEPVIFTLDETQFRKAAANNPYDPEKGKFVHLFFCDPIPAEIDYAYLDSLKSPTEEYQMIDNVFYLHAPDGIGRSTLVTKMGKAFKGVTMTARNLNTINKLLDMLKS